MIGIYQGVEVRLLWISGRGVGAALSLSGVHCALLVQEMSIQFSVYGTSQLDFLPRADVLCSNFSSLTHTVTSYTILFYSYYIPSYIRFSFTFNLAGTYQYHCIDPLRASGRGLRPPLYPLLSSYRCLAFLHSFLVLLSYLLSLLRPFSHPALAMTEALSRRYLPCEAASRSSALNTSLDKESGPRRRSRRRASPATSRRWPS